MVSRGNAERHDASSEVSDLPEPPEPPDPSLRAETFSSIPDSLNYMADMIAELRAIADKSDWTLLAAFLGLAHAEARAQFDRLVPRSAR